MRVMEKMQICMKYGYIEVQFIFPE